MSDEFNVNENMGQMAEAMGFSSGDDSLDSGDNDRDNIEDNIYSNDGNGDDNVLKSDNSGDIDDGSDREDNNKPDFVVREAPKSWAKEKHEVWAGISDDAKDYIEQREKQMLDGLDQYKAGYNYAVQIDKAIAPFRDMLEKNNLDPASAVHNLLSYERALTSGTQEQREKVFYEMGVSLGLITPEGQKEIDPYTRQLQERLDRIEQNERRYAEQQRLSSQESIQKQVEAFASDPQNPYFNEIADDILIELQAGVDLKTAYDRAVWANPITRAKLIASQQQQSPVQKPSVTNIKAAKTSSGSKPSKPTGSMIDTMHEVYRNLQKG